MPAISSQPQPKVRHWSRSCYDLPAISSRPRSINHAYICAASPRARLHAHTTHNAQRTRTRAARLQDATPLGVAFIARPHARVYARTHDRAYVHARRYCARVTRYNGRCDPTIPLVFCEILWISFTRKLVLTASRACARYC